MVSIRQGEMIVSSGERITDRCDIEKIDALGLKTSTAGRRELRRLVPAGAS